MFGPTPTAEGLHNDRRETEGGLHLAKARDPANVVGKGMTMRPSPRGLGRGKAKTLRQPTGESPTSETPEL